MIPSPEAQAEFEREMQRRIRIRKLRRKIAPFAIVFSIALGIILVITALNLGAPLLGIRSHPIALPLLILGVGCIIWSFLIIVFLISDL